MHTTTGPTVGAAATAAAAASRSDSRAGTAAAGTGSDPDPAMRPAVDRFGLGVASITPFAADGSVDLPRLVAHARRCLDEGCTSVTLFGTTGEGASLGFRERARMLDGFVAAGFDMRAQVLGGVAASAIEDAAAQARHIYAAGGRGILLTPPFYFKGPDDEGLYAWFSRVIEASGDARGVILYHLPSLTCVPLSVDLIGRLKRAFPGVVVGVKDSGGVWDYTAALLEAHRDLHILVGDERLLARAVRHGGSGAINGFSNFCAARLAPMVERGEDIPGLGALVDLLLGYPVTPAIKALVAHVTGDEGYVRAAPPLVALPAAARATLVAAFDALPAPR
jgi:4-hydroxy-tetrahydrodipicolinate synthase